MSLVGTLNIGRTALTANQAALQVTGNNIANAGNADYTRQVVTMTPSADQNIGPGLTVGTGVDLTSIQRQIDEALQGRLRASVSDDNAAGTTKQWLDRVESIFNELGDQDLSTHLSTFFNSWSKLATSPQDAAQRDIVIKNGQTLAGMIRGVRAELADVQDAIGGSIKSMVANADALAARVAVLNKQVAAAEGAGGGMANSLRDQRDAVLKQLSELVDVHTKDAGNGMINVFVGSEPLVLNGDSRGLTTKQVVVDGQAIIGVALRTTGGTVEVAAGQIGAMVGLQGGQIKATIDQLDSLAGNLIFELNKVYSGGQGADAAGLQGFTSVTAANVVSDTTAVLNSAASGLTFEANNGSFSVAVYDTASKQYASQLISVDLDGIGADDSLDTLAAKLNGVAGVQATVTAGKLTIRSTVPNTEVLFGNDTSGTLAALGINTFFTGNGARDIGVNSAVTGNSALLAAGGNWTPAGNGVATAIYDLQTKAMAGLGGATLVTGYSDMINQTAVAAATAQNNAEAASTVRQTLEAQRESLSGVSMDEEAVNLIKQQRAFQGAARLVAAIDEMMKTVLSLV
jgi:flagellar hook-associated protein 1 FlgK